MPAGVEENARLTRARSDQIEALIQQHSEQWMWIHDRWPTTPADLVARRRAFEAEAAARAAAAS